MNNIMMLSNADAIMKPFVIFPNAIFGDMRGIAVSSYWKFNKKITQSLKG